MLNLISNVSPFQSLKELNIFQVFFFDFKYIRKKDGILMKILLCSLKTFIDIENF